jgi:hypothetical protein
MWYLYLGTRSQSAGWTDAPKQVEAARWFRCIKYRPWRIVRRRGLTTSQDKAPQGGGHTTSFIRLVHNYSIYVICGIFFASLNPPPFRVNFQEAFKSRTLGPSEIDCRLCFDIRAQEICGDSYSVKTCASVHVTVTFSASSRKLKGLVQKRKK